MTITRNDLWAFVDRANTIDKIMTASEWLRSHGAIVKAAAEANGEEGTDLFDYLMEALACTSREIYSGERKEPTVDMVAIKRAVQVAVSSMNTKTFYSANPLDDDDDEDIYD